MENLDEFWSQIRLCQLRHLANAVVVHLVIGFHPPRREVAWHPGPSLQSPALPIEPRKSPSTKRRDQARLRAWRDRQTATASGTPARNVELEHPGTTPIVVANQEISTDSLTNSAADSHPELPPAEPVTAVNAESAAGEEPPTNSRSAQTFLTIPLDHALLEHEWHEIPWKDTTSRYIFALSDTDGIVSRRSLIVSA